MENKDVLFFSQSDVASLLIMESHIIIWNIRVGLSQMAESHTEYGFLVFWKSAFNTNTLVLQSGVIQKERTHEGEKSYIMQMNCSNCLLSRSSWYWSPEHSSVQLHVSSGWHFFLHWLPQYFWPCLGEWKNGKYSLFWRADFLTAYRCP